MTYLFALCGIIALNIYRMKTKEEALQALEESFCEFYPKRLCENPNNVKYIMLEEFEQRWHEILQEKYNKLKNENQERDKKA